MTENTLDTSEIERTLRLRYDELWEDVRRELRKHDASQYEDLIQGTPDPQDVATADLLVDLHLAEIDRDLDELRAVQHALRRLKSGTYGTCASCGQPIPAARLRAVPHATLCVECQERAERNRTPTPSL